VNVQDAAYRTVHNYPGGSESLAPRMDMSAAVLRGKVNKNNDRNVLSLDDADLMMGVSNDFQILHALAANHGFGLHPLDAGNGLDITTALLGAAVAKGDLAGVIARALEDNLITPNELADIGRACAALQAKVISIAKGAASRAASSVPQPEGRL